MPFKKLFIPNGLGMPPKLAAVWFLPDDQNVAIAIGVTANALGVAAGFLLTPHAVDPMNLDQTIPNYFFIQSVLFTIQLLALIFLFPIAPRVPPSAQVPTEPSTTTVLSTTRDLLSKPAFHSLAISYGLVVGVQYTIQTLLVSLILPFFIGHTEEEIGWLGFWMLILGILASLAGGWYLDRTYEYLKLSTILFIVTTVSLLSINLFIETKAFVSLCLSCLLYGMASSTLIPTLFQYGIIRFQAPGTNDDTSTIPGLLNSVAQVVGIILITLLSGDVTSSLSSWLLLFFPLLGMAFLGLSWLGRR